MASLVVETGLGISSAPPRRETSSRSTVRPTLPCAPHAPPPPCVEQSLSSRLPPVQQFLYSQLERLRSGDTAERRAAIAALSERPQSTRAMAAIGPAACEHLRSGWLVAGLMFERGTQLKS
jgi:hypothetical protein